MKNMLAPVIMFLVNRQDMESDMLVNHYFGRTTVLLCYRTLCPSSRWPYGPTILKLDGSTYGDAQEVISFDLDTAGLISGRCSR